MKQKYYMGDFKQLGDIVSSNSRLKYWISFQRTVNNQRRHIKYLHKKTVDLKNKIKTLDNLVNFLNDDNKLFYSSQSRFVVACFHLKCLVHIIFSIQESLTWLCNITILHNFQGKSDYRIAFICSYISILFSCCLQICQKNL